jgi:hypothetical protein
MHGWYRHREREREREEKTKQKTTVGWSHTCQARNNSLNNLLVAVVI